MDNYFYPQRISKFSDMVNLLLKEGVIASYNTDNLIKDIHKIFKSRVRLLPNEYVLPKDQLLTKYGIVYMFGITISDYNDNDKNQLNKLLELYGYYIVKSITIGQITDITIEPKYPLIINDILIQLNIDKLYHITHKSNLNKIKNIGFAPKETETTYFHPGNRIYLITGGINTLKAFKRTLSRDKGLNENDFIILSIPFNKKYTYYIDESSTKIDGPYKYIGCFILKNVPPNEINVEQI